MKRPSAEILEHAKMILDNIDNNRKNSGAIYKNFCHLTNGMTNEQLLNFFAELSSAIKYLSYRK